MARRLVTKLSPKAFASQEALSLFLVLFDLVVPLMQRRLRKTDVLSKALRLFINKVCGDEVRRHVVVL